MFVYYKAENIFRWYESKSGKSETHYANLSGDELERMQETISSPIELEKWLKRHQLPPDNYEAPFTGAYESHLVEEMLAEIQRFAYVKRFYALVTDLNSNVCDLLNVAAHCFLEEEQIDVSLRETHVKNLIKRNVPDFIAEMLSCVDEEMPLMVGVSPSTHNYFASAKIFSAMWVDICHEHGKEMQAKHGYDSGYEAKGTQVSIPWWSRPEAKDFIRESFEKKYAYILKSLCYYRRKGLDGDYRYQTYPGDWNFVIDKYTRTHGGPTWKSVDEMLSELLSGKFYLRDSKLWKMLICAMDDYLNCRLHNSEMRVDTQSATKMVVTESIADMLYICLSDKLMEGTFRYRKCLLCDRYFDYGNRPNRRYCDIHKSSNAEYHRKILNRKSGK